ncbi:MAG: hypothetical protein ACI95S_001202, partial [Dinoroseobacter sp.]
RQTLWSRFRNKLGLNSLLRKASMRPYFVTSLRAQ